MSYGEKAYPSPETAARETIARTIAEKKAHVLAMAEREAWGRLTGETALGGVIYWTFEDGTQVPFALPAGSIY